MTKIIVMALVVLVFFWLLRRALSGRKRGDPAGKAPGAGQPAPTPELVECAHCGVHLPQNEAFTSGDPGPAAVRRFFCTEEHLRLGPR